jgi:methionyl aminopeptidase
MTRWFTESRRKTVDVGSFIDGFNGDSARTFAIGEIDDEVRKLLEVTKQSLEKGISKALNGNRLGDISSAVQSTAEEAGFSIVRDLVGHGIGRRMHEDPQVPNYGVAGHGVLLKTGMVIAIEPMVNIGGFEVRTKPDKWTVVTADGSLSAHFEHTIAITDDGPRIMSL